MRIHKLLVVCLSVLCAFCFTGCGGSGGGSGSDVSAVLHSVRGTIYDSDGNPLSDALVGLFPAEGASARAALSALMPNDSSMSLRLSAKENQLQTRTDKDGNYTINNVPDGIYNLVAAKGNMRQTMSSNIVLSPKETEVKVDPVKLKPCAEVSGFVAMNGEFIDGLLVRLYKKDSNGEYFAVTKAKGEFKFVNVPFDTYDIEIVKGYGNDYCYFTAPQSVIVDSLSVVIPSDKLNINKKVNDYVSNTHINGTITPAPDSAKIVTAFKKVDNQIVDFFFCRASGNSYQICLDGDGEYVVLMSSLLTADSGNNTIPDFITISGSAVVSVKGPGDFKGPDFKLIKGIEVKGHLDPFDKSPDIMKDIELTFTPVSGGRNIVVSTDNKGDFRFIVPSSSSVFSVSAKDLTGRVLAVAPEKVTFAGAASEMFEFKCVEKSKDNFVDLADGDFYPISQAVSGDSLYCIKSFSRDFYISKHGIDGKYKNCLIPNVKGSYVSGYNGSIAVIGGNIYVLIMPMEFVSEGNLKSQSSSCNVYIFDRDLNYIRHQEIICPEIEKNYRRSYRIFAYKGKAVIAMSFRSTKDNPVYRTRFAYVDEIGNQLADPTEAEKEIFINNISNYKTGYVLQDAVSFDSGFGDTYLLLVKINTEKDPSGNDTFTYDIASVALQGGTVKEKNIKGNELNVIFKYMPSLIYSSKLFNSGSVLSSREDRGCLLKKISLDDGTESVEMSFKDGILSGNLQYSKFFDYAADSKDAGFADSLKDGKYLFTNPGIYEVGSDLGRRFEGTTSWPVPPVIISDNFKWSLYPKGELPKIDVTM